MKIFCVGRNYSDHAREMNAEVPADPVIFMKPETALVRNEKLYYPYFTQDLHYEGELVIKIAKNGKGIEPEYAGSYYDQITLGLDLTARDIQQQLKKKGLPWELSKSFDHSAVIGDWIPVAPIISNPIEFELRQNQKSVQKGSTLDMLFSINQIVSYISRFFTLKTGDLIFTGTPAGVGPIQKGDVFEGFINQNSVLKTTVY